MLALMLSLAPAALGSSPWDKVRVTDYLGRAKGCVLVNVVPIPSDGGMTVDGYPVDVIPLLKRKAYEAGGDKYIEGPGPFEGPGPYGSELIFRCDAWKTKMLVDSNKASRCKLLSVMKGHDDFLSVAMRKKIEDTVQKLGGNAEFVPTPGELHVLSCSDEVESDDLVFPPLPKPIETHSVEDVLGCTWSPPPQWPTNVVYRSHATSIGFSCPQTRMSRIANDQR